MSSSKDESKIMGKNYLKLAQLIKKMSSGSVINSADTFKTILDSGLDINYAIPVNSQVQHFRPEWLGNTALHFAIEMNLKDFLINLLLMNVSIICKNNKGFTPLRLAYEIWKKCNNGQKEFLGESLLSVHITSKIKTNPSCEDGISHFHIACITNHVTAVIYFLDCGVSVNKPISVNSTVFPGYTPLHLAISNENKDIVEILLEHGADYNFLNTLNKSPLHLIVEKQMELIYLEDEIKLSEILSNREDILDLVLKKFINKSNKVDSKGLSYFHVCCTKRFNFDKCKNILEKFLRTGYQVNASVSLNSPIWPGYTPLHFAAHCNFQAVMWLLKYGGLLLAKDANNIMPLDICFENYETIDIYFILRFQKAFESIKFENGKRLVDVLLKLDTLEDLNDYLDEVDVNSIIPFNSPLWSGFTLLHLAVFFDEAESNFRVDACLDHKINLTIEDSKKMTALHLAFHMNKEFCVHKILKCYKYYGFRSTTNFIDKAGLTYFHIACMVGNVNAVKYFLDCGIDPDLPVQKDIQHILQQHCNYDKNIPIKAGSRPLHIAVAFGNPHLAKLILRQQNVNPYFMDADGFTWVHRAFTSTNFFLFKDLLWLHWNALRCNPKAPGGLTHLHIACYSYNLTAVQFLLFLFYTRVDEPLTQELMKYTKNLPKNVCIGDTPLHLAVKVGCIEIVTLLLRSGANVEAKNLAGLNPLHVALIKAESRSINTEIIQQLAQEFEYKKKWPDSTGLTRLHVACALGDLDLIKQTLVLGDNVNDKINSDSPFWPDKTPLHILIMKNQYQNSEAYKFLLDQITNLQDVLSVVRPNEAKYGVTAFHLSCMRNDPDVVKRFIQAGVDINAPKDYFAYDDAGYTPLHFAVQYGSESIIELLLNNGANTELENSNGYNPLQLAALKCPDKIQVFLRSTEVSIENQNIFGQSVMNLLLDNRAVSSDVFLGLLKLDLAKKISIPSKLRLVTKLALKFPDIFESLIQNIPNLTDTDEDNRNVFHYLVLFYNLVKCTNLSSFTLLMRKGCNLDHQDREGKTPLHYSVLKNNFNYTFLFLSFGADINITDVFKKTPYTYSLLSRESGQESIVQDLLNSHVTKLKVAGLYLNEHNIKSSEDLSNNVLLTYSLGLSENLDNLKKVYVTSDISLRDILTEEVICEFPFMPLQRRRDIFEYFDSEEFQNSGNNEEYLSLFRLQQRRATKRVALLDSAVDALYAIIGVRNLPRPCLDAILIYLNNQDWQNIIVAARLL